MRQGDAIWINNNPDGIHEIPAFTDERLRARRRVEANDSAPISIHLLGNQDRSLLFKGEGMGTRKQSPSSDYVAGKSAGTEVNDLWRIIVVLTYRCPEVPALIDRKIPTQA